LRLTGHVAQKIEKIIKESVGKTESNTILQIFDGDGRMILKWNLGIRVRV
jgi:hypothetical protein